MSNISVTTTQNTIAVTEVNGITVTTPTGQTIAVTVPNTSVDVTNTTDDITVSTGGTVILESGVKSVNGDQGPAVVLTTTNINEGTNLYYTTARANSDFDTRLATKSTTNLAEGTNLYYTTARANTDFDTRLATKTTDNLNEGTTNLYFTNTRARQAISATDTGGDGSLSYDNSTGVITYTGPSASEVRAHFTAGTGVTITNGEIAIGQSVGTSDSPSFAGVTGGNITVGVATDNTIASTDTNGAITLDPNGTGNVVMTFANGGNLTNDRNYLFGAVRDTTTLNNGNIYALQSTISPTRGISLSNSDSPSSYRPGIMIRDYSGASGTTPRSWIVFENARGTVASPSAIQSGDRFCEIMAQGYNGSAWSGDAVLGTPFLFRASATEAWASSPARAGTKLEVICQPAGVTYTASTPMNIIDHQPTAATYRADTWDFRTRTTAGGGTNISQLSLDISGNAILAGDLRVNGNDIQASDGNTNITLNSNTSTTFAGNAIVTGDIRINGNDIQASDGNTNITLNSNLSTTFAGDIRVNGNDIQSSNGNPVFSMSGDRSYLNIYSDNTGVYSSADKLFSNIFENTGKVTQSLTQNRATSGNDFATSSWNTYRSTDSINYTPTQSGDVLGEFKFNGNSNTGTSPGVPGAPGGNVVVAATENWTSTANGTQMLFLAIKQGTLDSIPVISANPTGTEFRADDFTFANTAGSSLPGGDILYRRTYGCFHKMADITAAAADTVYNFDWYTDTTVHVGNQGVTVTSGNPTRLNIDTQGSYSVILEMHAQNVDNADRTAYIWLARNGTNLSETCIKAVLTKDTSTIITKDWLIDGIADNDYIEVRFAVDNTSGISLQYEAAQTSPYVRPAIASATITVRPIGA